MGGPVLGQPDERAGVPILRAVLGGCGPVRNLDRCVAPVRLLLRQRVRAGSVWHQFGFRARAVLWDHPRSIQAAPTRSDCGGHRQRLPRRSWLRADLPYTVITTQIADVVRVLYLRQFDLPGGGHAYLVDPTGERYGIEVDIRNGQPL